MKSYGESNVKKNRRFSCICAVSDQITLEILVNMGKYFGNLAKINGIVFFRLSPYEQKTFKGIISEGVPNTIRRIQGNIFRIAPFFMFSYLLVSWANEKNHALSRKNPKDYENDT
ncbi:cytochrome b-c1 complex subunit 8 [Pogonomyrmex barbatus]|uniref:Cytochrome b-c1 complex subunit 8 n=1 Tax=Pogonomyrmex barbatus TaxID=144034 RepID=A0A6I9WHY1_9HYME|nr:cytochrome b-c1 complex subunit 8 [Pogonomyrmex barbatus]